MSTFGVKATDMPKIRSFRMPVISELQPAAGEVHVEELG
jgi:hypothetical protein